MFNSPTSQSQKNFRKAALAIFVVGALALYGFVYRHGSSAVVSPPASLAPNSSSGGSSSTSGSGSTPAATTSGYKDGTYTGSAADAYYGNIQVSATISGGKITNVEFLQYPNDNPHSISVNTQAMPYLKQEAIAAQSAQVDIVSGATDTSDAFIQSLSSALAQAQ